MTTCRHPRGSRGFTLVELLAAVAIVAVLAALLLPAFHSARRDAWRATCLSNQRQIGAALALYLEDFDETYPNYRFEPLGSQQAGDLEKRSWRRALSPYVRDRRVMACPANPDNRAPSYDPEYPISYAANVAFNPRDYPRLPVPRDTAGSGVFGLERSSGVKAASIVRPAECIAVVEVARVPDSAFIVDIARDGAPSAWAGRTVHRFSDCLFTGHPGGRTNFLFTDGHVKALKPTATYREDASNYWYRDATPLGAEGRTTLAAAETGGVSP